MRRLRDPGRRSTPSGAALEQLLEGIHRRYGYDFRDYARGSLERRIRLRLTKSGLEEVEQLAERVLDDPSVFEELLQDLSIDVTEMFRDPELFSALRLEVIPQLAKRPMIRVWHAGCATGEEVYSLAILLQEADCYDRARIYATDISPAAIDRARHGIYPLAAMRRYTESYHAAGGRRPFSDYYKARYGAAMLDASLRRNVVFAAHDLVTEGPFGEIDLLLCRNVMTYFNRELQERAVALFANSLRDGGYLCVGSRESICYIPSAAHFTTHHHAARIYRNGSPDREVRE